MKQLRAFFHVFDDVCFLEETGESFIRFAISNLRVYTVRDGMAHRAHFNRFQLYSVIKQQFHSNVVYIFPPLSRFWF